MPALRERMKAHARSRARAFGTCAVVAIAIHALPARPPERSTAGLATWLGEAVGGSVRSADLAWEPQTGALAELCFGRGLWFLAAPHEGGPRDVYRAWVRLTPDGQPLTLRRVVQVTSTPLADEGGLLLANGRVSFASTARGRVDAVTVLAPPRDRAASLLDRLVARATFGGPAALARTDLVVDARVSSAAIELDERRVEVELADAGQRFGYDLARGAFTGDATGIAHRLARPLGEGAARLDLLALLRQSIGPELTALGGRAWFRASAFARRVLAGSSHAGAAADAPSGVPHFTPLARPWFEPPLGTDPRAGAPESYLSHARVTLARSRAKSTLELVGLDMRQLAIGVVGGTEWPEPAFGAPGSGRLPEDTERRKRVVAVFNGGPEAAYARYGTLSDGRLLVPPERRAPSLLTLRSGRTSLRPWANSDELPADVRSFAQRRTALVASGVAVPSEDDSVRRRSALCAARDGRFIYAYGDALDANELANALVALHCDYALPLAASPERLGFELANLASRGHERFEPVAPDMDFDGAATLTGSTRDFFYVTVRDLTPRLPASVDWQPDGGTQPSPAWLPGILAGKLALGGLSVRLVSFAGGRFDFRVRPGPLEPGAKGERWAGQLAEDARSRALAELELGHGTSASRLGLALGNLIPLPLKPANATLVLGRGTARILLPDEPVTLVAEEQAVQLPLLADDTNVTERARDRGAARDRSALCVTEDGRLVVALLRHDSSGPLVVALRAAGCTRVVELDRGSHHPASLERVGTDTPPREAPQSTTLWVLSRPTP